MYFLALIFPLSSVRLHEKSFWLIPWEMHLFRGSLSSSVEDENCSFRLVQFVGMIPFFSFLKLVGINLCLSSLTSGLLDNNPLKRGAGKKVVNVPPYTTTGTASAQIYTAFILTLKFSLTSVKLHLSEIIGKSGNNINHYHFTQ